MSRTLASIQHIMSVEPIEGADRIELATVLGWKCVVNKGQFKPGDKAVYFEIDSYLPIKPEFEFLRKSSYKNTELMGEGFRLRTQTFRGQVSQGLCLPASTFPEIPSDIEIGADVTELLGVRKYEIQEMCTGAGTVVGTLAKDVTATDETRIQSNPALLDDFAGLEYYISSKMDGTSCSISVDDIGFHAMGHNYEYKDDGKSGFFEFIKKRGFDQKALDFVRDNNLTTLVVQGEYCGPGIQKNRIGLKDYEWFVFTIKENGERVGLDRMLEICDALGFTHVPIEERGTDLPSKYPTTEALLSRADGNYETGRRKEGIVIRPTNPVMCAKIGSNLSVKVVSNKYLLKNDD